MEVYLPALAANNDNETNQPTDKPTNNNKKQNKTEGHEGKLHFQVFEKVSRPFLCSVC